MPVCVHFCQSNFQICWPRNSFSLAKIFALFDFLVCHYFSDVGNKFEVSCHSPTLSLRSTQCPGVFSRALLLHARSNWWTHSSMCIYLSTPRDKIMHVSGSKWISKQLSIWPTFGSNFSQQRVLWGQQLNKAKRDTRPPSIPVWFWVVTNFPPAFSFLFEVHCRLPFGTFEYSSHLLMAD